MSRILKVKRKSFQEEILVYTQNSRVTKTVHEIVIKRALKKSGMRFGTMAGVKYWK